jgi:hypothetical protein
MTDKLKEVCEREFAEITTEKECDKILREKSNELASAEGKYRRTLLSVIDYLLDRKLELKKAF